MPVGSVGSWQLGVSFKSISRTKLEPLHVEGNIISLGNLETDSNTLILSGQEPGAFGSSGKTVLGLKVNGGSVIGDLGVESSAPFRSIGGGTSVILTVVGGGNQDIGVELEILTGTSNSCIFII